jgi:RNA polymerase sigma-70 factor (ECF subfamily)
VLVNYSPGVALNRAFALYKVHGAKAALAEAEQLNLYNNHFYFVLLGELYKSLDAAKARELFQKAFALAKTQTEKEGIQQKIDELV